MYQGEQQDRGRVSSDWTVPGSRARGDIQEYSNWSEPELPGFSSPNFPFVLHRQDQRHQDLRWSSHGAVRDCDGGFQRDAWLRKWDQSQPSCHIRDVSAKRNDSSYRELEAWAARYSHSLPRRRRLEAELIEAVQGPLERSQAPERGKLVANPGVQLQHSQLNRNSGAPGDKAKPPATDTNRMKEKIAYHSRVFGKPPGYIGPPPYNRPHKSPAVVHHCDVGWHLVGRKQSDRSTFRNPDVPVDLQTKRKVEKDESKTYPDLEELESNKHKRDTLQRPGPIDVLNPEGALTQEPQAAQNSNVGKEEICKVIEGRKFRLKKKTGGMAIFCLVSRIASPSENPSLPVHTSQTSVRSTETGEKHSDDRKGNNHVDKLADDVDFREHTPQEQSDKKTLSCRESVMLKDDLPHNCVFLEKSGFERSIPESVEPVLTRYPLWREPSYRSKVEAERPNTNSVKENHEGGDVSGNSTDNKKKKPDILENAEDVRGLLVIDTSCVVVKVERIPSPKKEQVKYLGSTANEERNTPESRAQLYQDGTTDWNNETLQRNEDPEDELDSTLMEKQEQKESGVNLSSVQPPLLSEGETLEKRAERILGIPLQDDEQRTEDEEPVIDLCKEEKNEEAAPSVSGLTLEDTAEDVDVCQVEEEKDDIRKQKTNEEGKDFTESLQPSPDMTEECNTECQLETDNTSSQIDLKRDGWMESTCGESGNGDHFVDHSDSSSISLSLSNSRIKQGPDSKPDALSPDLDPSSHPDASPPPLQPPSLLPDDSHLSPTVSEDHLPPPLEVLVLAADVECGAKSKDDEAEMLHSAEYVFNDESLITEMKVVLPYKHNECHQRDDAPCIAERKQTEECDSSRAETKREGLNILAQQLRSEELDLQVPNRNLPNPIVQTVEENEANSRTCETLDNHFLHRLPKQDLEEEILCKNKRDVTPEPGQINPSLTASLLEQTGSSEGDLNSPTQLNTDSLQNSNSQGEFPDDASSSSRSEVLNKLPISDFSEREGDVVPLLQTESTVSPVSDDIAAAPDIMKDASDPIYLCSYEESSQLTMFLPQEEGVSPTFCPSSAHKKGSQCPKSLLDVVNRIRKHTAPDSESEEEEVSEQWDPNCLDAVADTKSEENFSDDLQVVFVDSAEIRQVDQDDIESEGHAGEDTLSCSSSHVSEDTVIVTDEERRLSAVVDKKKEESDTGEEELRFSSEEKDETQSEDSKAEDDNLNIYGSGEDIDQYN